MNRLLTAVLTMCILSGCSSYIRSIPTFPECKILKVSGFPAELRLQTKYHYTVWTNTAVDTVISRTYYDRDRADRVLLTQRGVMHHTQAPVSGVEFDWMSNAVGRYRIEVLAKNKYDKDSRVLWVDVSRGFYSSTNNDVLNEE